jgi:hypothetical protein
MAYDEDLAGRVRAALEDVGDVRVQRMFGGLADAPHRALVAGRLGRRNEPMDRCAAHAEDQPLGRWSGRLHRAMVERWRTTKRR